MKVPASLSQMTYTELFQSMKHFIFFEITVYNGSRKNVITILHNTFSVKLIESTFFFLHKSNLRGK